MNVLVHSIVVKGLKVIDALNDDLAIASMHEIPYTSMQLTYQINTERAMIAEALEDFDAMTAFATSALLAADACVAMLTRAGKTELAQRWSNRADCILRKAKDGCTIMDLKIDQSEFDEVEELDMDKWDTEYLPITKVVKPVQGGGDAGGESVAAQIRELLRTRKDLSQADIARIMTERTGKKVPDQYVSGVKVKMLANGGK